MESSVSQGGILNLTGWDPQSHRVKPSIPQDGILNLTGWNPQSRRVGSSVPQGGILNPTGWDPQSYRMESSIPQPAVQRISLRIFWPWFCGYCCAKQPLVWTERCKCLRRSSLSTPLRLSRLLCCITLLAEAQQSCDCAFAICTAVPITDAVLSSSFHN